MSTTGPREVFRNQTGLRRVEKKSVGVVAGLVVQRQVQADHVGLLLDAFQRGLFHVTGGEPLRYLSWASKRTPKPVSFSAKAVPMCP